MLGSKRLFVRQKYMKEILEYQRPCAFVVRLFGEDIFFHLPFGIELGFG